MQGQESPLKTPRQSGSASYKNFSDFPEPRMEPKKRLGTLAFRLFHKMALAACKRCLDPHVVSKASMGASRDSTLRPWFWYFLELFK